jgi:hypothetical protein
LESIHFLKYLHGGAFSGKNRAPMSAMTKVVLAREDGEDGGVEGMSLLGKMLLGQAH